MNNRRRWYCLVHGSPVHRVVVRHGKRRCGACFMPLVRVELPEATEDGQRPMQAKKTYAGQAWNIE